MSTVMRGRRAPRRRPAKIPSQLGFCCLGLAGLSADEITERYSYYPKYPELADNDGQLFLGALKKALILGSVGKDYATPIADARVFMGRLSGQAALTADALFAELVNELAAMSPEAKAVVKAARDEDYAVNQANVAAINANAAQLLEQERLDNEALAKGGWAGDLIYASGYFGTGAQKSAGSVVDLGEKTVEGVKSVANWSKPIIIVGALALLAYYGSKFAR